MGVCGVWTVALSCTQVECTVVSLNSSNLLWHNAAADDGGDCDSDSDVDVDVVLPDSQTTPMNETTNSALRDAAEKVQKYKSTTSTKINKVKYNKEKPSRSRNIPDTIFHMQIAIAFRDHSELNSFNEQLKLQIIFGCQKEEAAN